MHYLSIALQHTATHGNTLQHAAMHVATIGMIVTGLCVMPLHKDLCYAPATPHHPATYAATHCIMLQLMRLRWA